MPRVYQKLEELFKSYKKRKVEIRNKLQEFKNIKPNSYFYELLFCCLTPQTSAKTALKAQLKFEKLNLIKNKVDPKKVLFSKENYIRFHNSKAKYILFIKKNYKEIEKIILSSSSSEEKREWIAKNVKGLGLKEATHFLRNVGLNGNLAILDRHILSCLKKYSAIKSLPKTLSKKNYLQIEKKFQTFATDISIPINELDLLFWSEKTGEIIK